MSVDTRQGQPSTPWSPRGWTMAGLALVTLALVLRVAGLASAPLDPLEASHSITAWRMAVGNGDQALGRLDPPPESALLVSADRLLFWVAAGAGDGLARALTALAGAALVVLPIVLAPADRSSGLVLAVLLAIDPWLIAESRRADGAVVAAAAALVCYLSLRRLAVAEPTPAMAAVGRRQWIVWGSAAGLLLVSGASAWDYLPPLLAAIVLLQSRRAGAPLAWRPPIRAVAAAAAFAAVLGSTGLLMDWSGPGLVSTSLDSWLDSWSAGVAPESSSSVGGAGGVPVIAIVFRAALLLLTIWGLFRAWSRPQSGVAPAGRFDAEVIGLWLVWGLLLQLRPFPAGPGTDPATALALELPLLLGANLGIEGLASSRLGRGASRAWRRATIATVSALAAVVALAGFERPVRGEDRLTLPPARRLARDIAVLEQRPAAERPMVEVESSGPVDAVLAWYLRDTAARWVPRAGSAAGETTAIIALRQRTAPPDSAPSSPDSARSHSARCSSSMASSTTAPRSPPSSPRSGSPRERACAGRAGLAAFDCGFPPATGGRSPRCRSQCSPPWSSSPSFVPPVTAMRGYFCCGSPPWARSRSRSASGVRAGKRRR
jgi:hypothetical protein